MNFKIITFLPNRLIMSFGIITMCIGSSVMATPPDNNPVQRIAALETAIVELQATVVAQQAEIVALQTQFGTHTANAVAHHTRYEDTEAIVAVGPHYTDSEAIAAVGPHFSGNHDDLSNVTPDQHHADMADSPIFDLEPFVSVDYNSLDNLSGPHILFEGANIHVRSGSGSTNDGGTGAYYGLGNLIIGYNENCCGGPSNRVGSHNVVIGTYHQYTSYAGFVAGHRNQLHAASGSISGGYENTVEGIYTSVLGGHFNTATVLATSISGGLGNLSSNHFSSISGGFQNITYGPTSTVGGGAFRTTHGDRDWAAGSYYQDE